jgi:NAD-dependent dihydropyrimidine dehydrogenase PreA subunit
MKLLYLRNVVTLHVDAARCVGCGMCAIVCPRAVLAVEQGKARIVERDACMECGACARNCPVDAVSVRAGTGCATAEIGRKLGAHSLCCEQQGTCCSCPPSTPVAPSSQRPHDSHTATELQ